MTSLCSCASFLVRSCFTVFATLPIGRFFVICFLSLAPPSDWAPPPPQSPLHLADVPPPHTSTTHTPSSSSSSFASSCEFRLAEVVLSTPIDHHHRHVAYTHVPVRTRAPHHHHHHLPTHIMATLTKYWPASKYRAAHPSYADDHARILAANVFPTPADCATLAEPIIQFLSQCTCYDMMGSSTQVVVIDVEAPLSVAFIAAQETRVQNCVLWSATQRQFVGVLSSTDYMKVLLYCDAHPQDADAVATWSIQQWRQTRDELESGGGFSAVKRPPASARRGSTSGSPVGTPSPLRGVAAATSAARPAGLITCRAETPLRECLQKMRDQHVRRIVTIADKEGESCSVVSLMDVEQIVEYLGVMFFHMEKAAASGRGGADASSNRASSPALEDQGSGLFASYGDILLPPHVNSILSNVETNDAGRSEPAVGPYHSIFDIPLKFLPKVGAHREQPISVSMEHPLRDALALMLQHNIESIAVCNAEQVIEDVLSRSDLLRMEDQGVYDTKLTVREALTSRASERLCVCYETDSLRDIFAHFVRWRIKELFLVHPTTGKLKGQINTSEIVFFIALGATSA